MWKHPDYDKDTYANDLSLIELETPIDIHKYRPIRLDNGFNVNLEAGDTLTAVGWGVLDYDSGEHPDVLMEVDLGYIENDVCAEDYGYPSHWIEDNMMCTWEEGKDACIGDSGGPLILRQPGKENDRAIYDTLVRIYGKL